MEININQETSIGEIKSQFQSHFKSVRIEFYHHAHEKGKGSSKDDQIQDHVKLNELVKTPSHIHMEFDKTIKISDLEKIFDQDCGLHIQVFRKYGDSWLQTTLSDHWTLQMAEIAAKELETIKNEKPNFD
jgi:hypothetical protein